jgi:hypothetical protein
MANEVIVVLYMMAMFFGLISVMCGGLLIWFRKAVFDQLKLKKLIKLGYIICRLKREDRTEKDMVARPDRETGGVKFPGVDGIYTVVNEAIYLKDRKYPTIDWREGETLPIIHSKEVIISKTVCPKCDQEVEFKVAKDRSISPAVLNNLILKIKTLLQMTQMKDMVIYLIAGGAVILIAVGIGDFLIYDLGKRMGSIITPIVAEACKGTAHSLGNITIIP